MKPWLSSTTVMLSFAFLDWKEKAAWCVFHKAGGGLTAKAAPFAIGAFGERGRVTIVGLRAYASPIR